MPAYASIRSHATKSRQPWPLALLKSLGTAPDSHLARHFNIGTERIKYLRMARGIAAFTPPVVWTKVQDRQLGKKPDTELARIWKRHPSSVAYRREKLGIAPYKPPKAVQPWLKELGKVSDCELARRYGCGSETIRGARVKHQIPACPRAKVWNRAMEALLGAKSDNELAKAWKVSVDFVRRRRIMLFIPPYMSKEPRTKWTPEMLHALGTAPDRVLAKRWGMGRNTVVIKRRELRIEAFEQARLSWSETSVRDLGRLPDLEVAAKYGISAATVRSERKRRGIAAMPPRTKLPWTHEQRLLLGTMSDDDVALRLGISGQAVAAARKRLGVPRFRPSWPADVLARLGKETDAKIAADLGVSPTTVAYQRRKYIGRHQR